MDVHSVTDTVGKGTLLCISWHKHHFVIRKPSILVLQGNSRLHPQLTFNMFYFNLYFLYLWLFESL